MKNIIIRLTAAVLALGVTLGIVGCESLRKTDKVELTMYLWDKSMTRELTLWLEEQFPDIDFTFIIGYNTMEFYTDLNERGELPDIITCRRFSLNDAAHMSDLLMDLSETDVVGSYYDSYIENNREPGGAVRWLPMCAEVDGYIANLDLFEKYDIPLPTNYAEFAEACRRFDELGLRCYVNDYREDYTCMETLQGCAIPQLMTMNGVQWRRKYESETGDTRVGLDKTVWQPAFDNLERYLKDTRVAADEVEMSYQTMKEILLDGKTAIMRGTANDCAVLKRDSGISAVMLPYFGETSADSWLLTYPLCQVAVNREVERDSKKYNAVMRVLDAMFSEEGQRHTAVNNAVLSYNKNVNIQLSDTFSMVMDCIESNHLYMRLASTEMFAVSKDVVQKMIIGEYDADEAYQAFNKQLTAPKQTGEAEIAATLNTGYDYTFGEYGSPAASAAANTLRVAWGSDIAVGYSSVVASSVFAGDYTAEQLNRILANRLAIRHGSLTGSELKLLMEWLVNTKEDGSNPIRHKNLIPVVSGMEYSLKDNRDGTYTLGDLTLDGKPLDENAVYSVMIFGDESYITNPEFCNCPMPGTLDEKLECTDTNIYTLFRGALSDGNQMEAPTKYVSVEKNY